ncbi:MAG: hypothetical protein R2838_25625 [Caldilineaceae bacterium]
MLGYLMAQPFVTVPIVGCRTEAQLRDSLTVRTCASRRSSVRSWAAM